ncbi:N-acetylglucosamine kinase [Mangrovicella endophytica]|uniref:N-acetylglucosamine kinase n=1 Tax=Mangrovicella endophytica TaxID=2066697 RepID=UPI001300104C|nr:BadF/BadG/BcrA/BcrD ATPase family protein [Mangrovicella endophytica]
MTLLLGVDSGGTKTLAALASRDGEVVQLIEAPSLDPSGGADWQLALRDLLGGLAELPQVSAAAFGLPFHGEIDAYSAEQLRVARSLMPIEPVVDNDVRIAFDGAFAGGAGALILAGTGSMAWASLAGPSDPHIRVGGWGDVFGDEGSAFWVGRETLSAISRELDGRSQQTAFSDAVLQRLGLRANELIAWCYGREQRRRDIAWLAIIVSQLADDGLEAARRLLQRAGDELADTLLTAWRRAAGDAPLRWSFAGGLTDSAIVMQRIEERAGCEPLPRRLPPVGGALCRAAIQAGWDVSPQWVERVNASLRRFPALTPMTQQEARA